jgi:hypothetical protein
MADDIIPGDIQDFILQHIDSITQLEALLLLRADPDGRWEPARVARRLYTGEREVEAVLAGLCATELLSCDQDVYRYDPRTDENRSLIDRLAAVYGRHLIPVTNMIHAKERRIREFANAFRFRKDR